MVYKKFCVSCHGAAGDASTPARDRLHAPDLRSDKVQKQTDDELYKGIAYGYGHKEYPHVFIGRGVTQSQIKAVVAYIRRLGNADRKGKTRHEENQ